MKKIIFCLALFGSSVHSAEVVINGLTFEANDQTGQILKLAHPLIGLQPFLQTTALAGTGLVVKWSVCNASGVAVDGPDQKSVCLSARVFNYGSSKFQGTLAFPDLRGLRPIGSATGTELRMALGVINPFVGSNFSTEYGGGIYERYALRWIDYGNYSNGVSVFQKAWLTEGSMAGTPHASLKVERNGPDQLRIAWMNRIEIPVGGYWPSDEFIFTFHRGGWAKGIEPFRRYVQQMQTTGGAGRVNPVPDHVRDGVGFRTAWMVEPNENQFAPKTNFKFTQLGDLANDSKIHGLSELVLWGATRYKRMPMPLEPAAGTDAEFLAGHALAAVKGVNVSLFVNLKDGVCEAPICPGNNPPVIARPQAGEPSSFDPRLPQNFWTYHSELVPGLNQPRTPVDNAVTIVADPDFFVDHYPNRIAIREALVGLALRGAGSFTMDEFQDNGVYAGGLVESIQQIRTRMSSISSGLTFSGEPVGMNMERAAQVLDYTWSWNDYIEAGPYLNSVRYPRLNVNINQSARVTKMGFIDGLYLNVMPRAPGKANGSAMIASKPELSDALKTVTTLRAKFLDYFVNGVFIGESVMSAPVTPLVRKANGAWIGGAPFDFGPFEYSKIFVKGYQLKASGQAGRLLVFAMNNDSVARPIVFQSEPRLWVDSSSGYQAKGYTEAGVITAGVCTLTPGGGDAYTVTFRTLKPLEIAVCEIAPN